MCDDKEACRDQEESFEQLEGQEHRQRAGHRSQNWVGVDLKLSHPFLPR